MGPSDREAKHSCGGTTSPPPDRPSRATVAASHPVSEDPTPLHLGLPLVWRRTAPIHQPEEATGRNEPSASQNRAKRNHRNQHPSASDPAMQCRSEALVPPRGLKNAASVAPSRRPLPISAHAVASAFTSVGSAGLATNLGAQPLVDVRCGFSLLTSPQLSIGAYGGQIVGDIFGLGRFFRKAVFKGLRVCTLLNHLDASCGSRHLLSLC